MALAVSDVLDAAEVARRNGQVLLCTELLQLAELLIPGVDAGGTALSRLAVQAIQDRIPIGAAVAHAFDVATAAELRHVLLEGERR